MPSARRTAIVRALLVAGGWAGARLSFAQEAVSAFPSRTIRLVSSGVVGGLTDNVARIVGERLAVSPEIRGQAVIVENKPGAGGIISMTFVAMSPPDGYLIKFADLGQTSIIPALHEKPPYVIARDFAPVSLIGTTPLFLSVNTTLGVNSFAEWVALVKARPNALSYGTSGPGSIHHLATETLKRRLGLDIVHVPYKGSGQSTPALIANEIQVLFTAIGPMAGHVKAGRARLLAVASPERTPQAPEVPAFAELGVKDMSFVPSVGALVPAGTPRPILMKLAEELRRALKHPDTVQRFERIGIDVVGSTPEQYAAQLEADIAFYGQAVKVSGAKAD